MGPTGLLVPRIPRQEGRAAPSSGHGGDAPPRPPGDGGGGGGPGAPSWGSGKLGLAIVFFAIGTLFLVFLAGYLMLRRKAAAWPPPGGPRPPRGLWISTLILLSSGLTMHRAMRSLRSGAKEVFRRWLGATLALGALFLLVQLYLWRELLAAGLSAATNAYGAIFYSLTGLHGLHILGGLVFLAFLLARAGRRELEVVRSPAGLCAAYWHFMDGIWLVLFFVLYFAS